jgi:mycofactocin system glycosyltransferase
VTPTDPDAPLPFGFRLAMDPDNRQLADDLWFGGSPVRVLRLTPAGCDAWRHLSAESVDAPVTGVLARRLTDTGFAHPCPPPNAGKDTTLTVVIPVRDRAPLLARCLAALDGRYPVLVVDDGSTDPAAVANVAAQHHAKVVRRHTNGGPSAARNTGLNHVSTELVAFLDSDCVPTAGWIDQLVPHFADPLVAAVAPRVTGLGNDTTWAARYIRATSSLDMGDRPARVAPNTRLSYVPTAALLARRSALFDVSCDGAVFDPSMRVGEDVDLVWRLHKNGWRIRYEPAVCVAHHEPTTWPALLGRRLRYGTSAAPLAVRHPDAVPPLVLHPWPALTVAALLAGRPLSAIAAYAASVLTMNHTLRTHRIPTRGTSHAMADAAYQTWQGLGRYATQFGTPALIALVIAGGRRPGWGRWQTRLAGASLLLGPSVVAWATRRSQLDPVRYVVAAVADDIAYGAGVWAGCLTHRTAAPVRPVISWRPLRLDVPETRGQA